MFEGVQHINGIISGISSTQKVVSNNIANAHTPGYVRQEHTFTDILGTLNNPFETQMSRRMGSMSQSSFVKQDSGQPVDLAQEMVQMQKNMLHYTMATRRLSTLFNNIRRSTQIGR